MQGKEQHVLITGGAGFIGSHVSEALLKRGWQVTAIDNFDPYYDRGIKEANLMALRLQAGYRFVETDLLAPDLEAQLPDTCDAIIHIAAKAGVRPSIQNPAAYVTVNVEGTHRMLEWARQRGIGQFVFASSSSVYGVNPRVPWREADSVLQPISPYASTKVSGELLGHVYSHLYGIRFLALRFFTVYGPRQRPDLAIHKFTQRMLAGEEIPVFGDGGTSRDYTYVGDIVEGVCAALTYTDSRYEVMNVASGRTISLADMIASLERVLGTSARIKRLPEQAGDVPLTYADISKAQALLNYRPQTEFEEGLRQFYTWMTQAAEIR